VKEKRQPPPIRRLVVYSLGGESLFFFCPRKEYMDRLTFSKILIKIRKEA